MSLDELNNRIILAAHQAGWIDDQTYYATRPVQPGVSLAMSTQELNERYYRTLSSLFAICVQKEGYNDEKVIPSIANRRCDGFSSMSQASLQLEMNQLFGSMTNTTAPGVFESQRRGVISGGSVVVRNRIMIENLVSMVPPSFQAGCGGIDMFAGSLSFVNADQFVRLLRSVAANAKGYAFQLALSAMCEKCSQHMETLQKKIQQLNEYFGNSCQMAQES